MALRALIILPTKGATWISEMDLPFPPFPGLGIRVDAYEVLNVDSVVVGDSGYDVTCIVHLENSDASEIIDEKCESLGFRNDHYP